MAQIELDKILAHVSKNRRGFLRTLIIGSAVVASPVMMSRAMAAAPEGGSPKPGEEGGPANADGSCNGDLVFNKKKGVCAKKKKKEGE